MDTNKMLSGEFKIAESHSKNECYGILLLTGWFKWKNVSLSKRSRCYPDPPVGAESWSIQKQTQFIPISSLSDQHLTVSCAANIIAPIISRPRAAMLNRCVIYMFHHLGLLSDYSCYGLVDMLEDKCGGASIVFQYELVSKLPQ